ncbi:tetratricopeptide repeat protein [Arcobacter sp.]|uniref:tetratricopeptide repeat protein n=1 Tax=Arcobacter sp. TaxID=1872629 RepID=UPI003C7409EC
MYCPHCNENSLSSSSEKLSNREVEVFECKRCNKKSYIVKLKAYEENPIGYTLTSALFIGSFYVSFPLNIMMLIVAIIIAIFMMMNKDTIVYKPQKELYDEEENSSSSISFVLIFIAVVIFIFNNGSEDKPIGKEVVFKSTKDMDIRLKGYREAVEWYKESSVYSESAFNLGNFYINKYEDYIKAIKYYKEAYKIDSLEKAAFKIALAYEDLENYEEAIKWYFKLMKSDGLIRNDVLINIALLYKSKLKDYTNAIKYYEIAIKEYIYGARRGIAWLYHENLKDDIKASAYMINRLTITKDKEKDKDELNDLIDFFKTTWNLSDETIKKGYELQLNSDEFPIKFKGGI